MSATTRTAPDHCPACSHAIDAATSAAGDYQPSPGDVSVCANCATLLTFSPDLKVRLATPAEYNEINADGQGVIAVLRDSILASRTLKPYPFQPQPRGRA